MLSATLLLLCLTAQNGDAADPATVAPAPNSATTAKKRPANRTADVEEDDDQWVEVTHEPGFLDLFTADEIRFTGKNYLDRPFRYRLFNPVGPASRAGSGISVGPASRAGPAAATNSTNNTPTLKWPLIVWLHGKGEAGDDNSSHLRHLSTLIFTKPWQRERYPFFLLALQCPRDNPVWTSSRGLAHIAESSEQNVPVPLSGDEAPGDEASDDMLDVLLVALNKTLAEHPIDRDRILVGGVSSGGSGSWELALREPDLFAAVAPLGSGGADNTRVKQILGVPVWSFHSINDPRTPIDLVRETVSTLDALGGKVQLTEVRRREHDCWHAAFEDYDLLAWLLAQRRGDPASPAPGSLSVATRWHLTRQYLTTGWTLPQLAGQFGIPLVLILAIYSARRQKRLRRESREFRVESLEPEEGGRD